MKPGISKQQIRPAVLRLRRLLQHTTKNYDPGDTRTPFEPDLDECEVLIDRLDDFLVNMGWQDPSRTYTPAERQLAVRLDRSIAPA